MKRKCCNKKTGKSTALLVSLVLIIVVSVGGTVAFLSDSVGPLANIFNPSQVTTKVHEDITTDNTKKQNVEIENTGNTDAWIRAAVVVTWKNSDGYAYGQAPVENVDYVMDYGKEHGWVKGSDGFWYYTNPVAPGAKTDYLIDVCNPVGSSPAEGYYLNVEIIGSGIQSKPASVFNNQWKSSGLEVDTSNADPMQWTLD